jgi:hypothetical protein
MHPLFEDYLQRLTIIHREFEATLKGLSTEALDWSPGPDMNSLTVLVVHVAGSTRYWVGDVGAQIPSNRDRAAEFQAKGLDEETLLLRLTDVRTFVRGVLENLSIDDLSIARTVPGRTLPNGEPETFTVGDALLHALEHTALHVGHAQMTRQLWEQRKA